MKFLILSLIITTCIGTTKCPSGSFNVTHQAFYYDYYGSDTEYGYIPRVM